MSRYRWLRPLKCIETMDFLAGTKGSTFAENEKLLFERVSSGDIRAMLNDEIVSKAHIGSFLALYSRANPDQEPFTIPPDIGLSLDDLYAVFDRPAVDTRKRGRPRKEHNGWPDDRKLAAEMHGMLAGRPGLPLAKSAAEAARMLVDQGRVSGSGTPESRAKRLERAFRKYHSS
jgi:hypothetical protein